MSGPFHIAESWRRSLRRAQATKLIILACLTGAITGAATVAFVELINLVQWAAIGSAVGQLLRLPAEQTKTLTCVRRCDTLPLGEQS
jgi:hypothetical protein